MKVFVTGATGFIGGNLVRCLLKRGYAVRALVREGSNRKNLEGLDIEIVRGDLRDPLIDLMPSMRGCGAVFHVAAAYSFWTPDVQSVIDSNLRGTQRVLEAAARANVTKVVYTSSETTIGIKKGCLGCEDAIIDRGSLHGYYKRTKLDAERYALAMWKGRGLPVVVVNPTMPIGPYDVKPTPTGQVIVDYLNRRMPAYVETGMNVVDVEDVAVGHILAMEKGRPGERYLLGNRNVTFKEMLSLIEQASGLKAPRWRMPLWLALTAACADELIVGRMLRRKPRIPIASVRAASKPRFHDCSKAVRELGMPQSPVEQAFCKSVQWFRENGYVHRS